MAMRLYQGETVVIGIGKYNKFDFELETTENVAMIQSEDSN